MSAREVGRVEEIRDLVVDVGIRVGEGWELRVEHVEGVGGRHGERVFHVGDVC